MKVLIRADASRWMGSGHVMRCLTLADGLRRIGADCVFVCARLDGNLTHHIRSMGFPVFELPAESEARSLSAQGIGVIEQDALQTRHFTENLKANWIVVDHYELDASWESIARPTGAKLIVLDDLANRLHKADVLVDQNLGRIADDYRDLVAPSCEVLTGSRYAMIRQEFVAHRQSSLLRRKSGTLNTVLMSFGGADSDNVTGRILELFIDQGLQRTLRSLVVVLGSQSAWKEETAGLVAEFGARGRLLCDVDNMAEIMSAADLSIGGGGTTAWERCCLGLPSLLLAIANNQVPVCTRLGEYGAADYLGDARGSDWPGKLLDAIEELTRFPEKLTAMSRQAGAVCDGMGVDRLINRIVESG